MTEECEKKYIERLLLEYPELKDISITKDKIEKDYNFKKLAISDLKENPKQQEGDEDLGPDGDENDKFNNEEEEKLDNELKEPNFNTSSKEPLLPKNKKASSKDNNSLVSKDSANYDKISLMTLIFYSLPSFGKMSCLILLNVNSTVYYESLGANLIFMSFFVILSRCIEIILKPIVAHISDETVSMLGRRKPYMIIGCFFYAAFLFLLFSPPTSKTDIKHLSMWYGIFFILFFIAESCTIPPYLALGPELSENSLERERLYFFFYIFQYIGVLFSAAMPILLNKFFSYYNPCDCSYCNNYPILENVEKCIRNCQILCGVRNNEKSLMTLTLFMGIFFIGSIFLLSYQIKEKNGSFNKEKMGIIASITQLFNNKPFLSLIIPWLLDVTIITLFSTMLPFFLNIILNPQKFCIMNNLSLDSISCSVNFYLGVTICVFFIFCIVFCNLWHYLASKFGKRKCWQTYSLLCVIPFFMFSFCDIGTYNLLYLCAILSAFPCGGLYLNDVLVSDTIQYDEFYTGKRNEGIFTVCSALLPKFVSLFAQAIPLSLLSIFGFVGSENGYVHTQPNSVKLFIKMIFSFIPICLSLLSYFFKLRYPICNESVNTQIKKSVDVQKQNYMQFESQKVDFYYIDDPVYYIKREKNEININDENTKITKINDNNCDNINNITINTLSESIPDLTMNIKFYRKNHINLLFFSTNDSRTKNLCENFSNFDDLINIYKGDYKTIKVKVLQFIIISIIFSVVGLVLIFVTFDYLSDQKLSFIPTTFVFIVTFCVITLGIYYIKLREIREVMEEKFEVNNKLVRLLIFQKIINENYEKCESLQGNECQEKCEIENINKSN